MPPMPWILVTPASRGLGLSLARRLVRTTELPIVATTRGDIDETRESILAEQLDAEQDGYPYKPDSKEADAVRISLPRGTSKDWGARLDVQKLDVTDEDSIAAVSRHCQDKFGSPASNSSSSSSSSSSSAPAHLHLGLVLTGKLYPEKSPRELDYEELLDTFKTNAIGPMLMMKHFYGFLPRKASKVREAVGALGGGLGPLPADHATWATLSARVGSITDNNRLGGWYSYRASKAAVNQITKTLDNQLRTSAAANALAISLHPGTVKTGLSERFWQSIEPNQLFSPAYSAERLVNVISTLDAERGRGKCWDWAGKEVPP